MALASSVGTTGLVRGRLFCIAIHRIAALNGFEPGRLPFQPAARRMVGFKFRSRRAAMGDGPDGFRPRRLPRLWSLAAYPRVGTPRSADRRNRALLRRHLL